MRLIFVFLTISFSSSIAETATLTGTIELSSKKPSKRIAQRYADTDLSELGNPAPTTAVVYLTSDSIELPAKTEDVAVMKQEGLWFHPSVLPVLKGTKVEFPNLDNTYHNVFSYSSAKRFDLGRYRKGEGPPYEIFDKAGVIKIFCEVHEHMRATILVLETPYFATTDEEGNFSITEIPRGEYIANVWVDSRTQWEQSITISSGENKLQKADKAD